MDEKPRRKRKSEIEPVYFLLLGLGAMMLGRKRAITHAIMR